MALTGVQIFKYLPKTYCKKCGFPTCLAFAMKLAARQVSIEKCPDLSAEAKDILGAASAPPMRPVTISVECASGDGARFEAVVKSVASKAPDLPLILNCFDASAAQGAVKAVADK